MLGEQAMFYVKRERNERAESGELKSWQHQDWYNPLSDCIGKQAYEPDLWVHIANIGTSICAVDHAKTLYILLQVTRCPLGTLLYHSLDNTYHTSSNKPILFNMNH